MSERKYTFIVEWFDPTASLIKQFYLTYFVPAQQIEMVPFAPRSTTSRIKRSSSRRSSTPTSSSPTSSSAMWLSATIASSRSWPSEISSRERN